MKEKFVSAKSIKVKTRVMMLIQYLEIMSGKLCNLLWLTFKNLFYFDCVYVAGGGGLCT